ncbi:hypothetical protein [Dactylosporangium sp. CS-033363]|uniref:hypothetical protein n=1 Tax=Dactylosporangium sp. CS-033363 TaxID=3239935 RepID=UPI003D937CBF
MRETSLESRYRRLLRAYPAAYRRERGDEIVTILLDTAKPGQTRPTRAEVKDLIANGVRQRFRLPVGRLMVVAAACSALAVGGIGAAAGSTAGWASAADPSDAEVATMLDVAAGKPLPHQVSHTQHQTVVEATTTDPLPAAFVRARLEEAGWVVDVDYAAPATIAERGGVVLTLATWEWAGTTSVTAVATPAVPPFVAPLTVAGAIGGALAGWLLAAWMGYRAGRSRTAILALVLLAPSTAAAWYRTARAVRFALESEHVGYTRIGNNDVIGAYVSQPPLAAAGLVVAALAIGLAALVRNRPKVATLP